MTRREAHEIGAKKFWTGKPCKHGHTTPRWVVSGACVACQAGYTTTFKSKLGVIGHPDSVSVDERIAGFKLWPVKAHRDDVPAIKKFAADLSQARGAIAPPPAPPTVIVSNEEAVAAHNASMAEMFATKPTALTRLMDRLGPPVLADVATVMAEAAIAPNVMDLGDGTRFVNDPAGPYILYADGSKISC